MSASWHERLLGGFRKTSDRLMGNLAGLSAARLDDETLDEIEEALIASDLGPETAARVRVADIGELAAFLLSLADRRGRAQE